MIKEISNELCKEYGKKNWIDQNNVVFGFSDTTQCCEGFGWAVYDPKTRKEVQIEPEGLPYHFDFEKGASEIGGSHDNVPESVFGDFHDCDELDCVQVTLVHDEDEKRKLVFQCYTDHNRYYYHDFAFRKIAHIEVKPRMFIVRGLPGSGKSTLAREYDCLRLEDDMFAIAGGIYHWNDQDGSGMKALDGLHEAIRNVCSKKIDFVLSSVLPFCSSDPEEKRGFTLYKALKYASEYGYDIYIITLNGNYGNGHGCPPSVYKDIFLDYTRLRANIREVFDGEDFVGAIKWYKMPTEIEVDNTAWK